MTPENFFAGGYLDRRAAARMKADWLEEALADPDAVCVAMRGTAALMRGSGEQVRLALLPTGDARVQAAATPDRALLLGWFRGQRCLLLRLPEDGPEGAAAGETFGELRPLANTLPAQDAGLLAYARALAVWHSTHRHCSSCGNPTLPARAGHQRQCVACAHQSFPRIDPAIIVLVHDGDRALLGRQASWPPGRYSTIAGFVEPGESLEDAVRREVAEETGIELGEITYHSSQPWPFPASLMLGFSAQGTWAPPQLGDEELEDARWFTRDEIRRGVVWLPPSETISRRLIDHWLQAAD